MAQAVYDAVYDHLVMVDTSAIIALLDPNDSFHTDAQRFTIESSELTWCSMAETAHELFTRIRYGRGLPEAFAHFEFLRKKSVQVLRHDAVHETQALEILRKYSEVNLSFHDALCAAVMLRSGVYRIFSFDGDFWPLGFLVMPGQTANR